MPARRNTEVPMNHEQLFLLSQGRTRRTGWTSEGAVTAVYLATHAATAPRDSRDGVRVRRCDQPVLTGSPARSPCTSLGWSTYGHPTPGKERRHPSPLNESKVVPACNGDITILDGHYCLPACRRTLRVNERSNGYFQHCLKIETLQEKKRDNFSSFLMISIPRQIGSAGLSRGLPYFIKAAVPPTRPLCIL